MDQTIDPQALTKAALRAAALGRRNALDPAFRASASAEIARRMAGLLARYRPKCVAAYLPIGSECDTGPIIAAVRASGAEVGLPAIVARSHIVFRRHRPDDPLVQGGFGTSSPGDGAPEIEPDLMVMPLVGFDATGARLGYGRGYYDGAIGGMRRRPVLIGIGFSVQKTGPIPVESHDVRLDWIVTEADVLDFRDKKKE
jgi:5-formyltetrahydrofolate cyclo-ligase